MNSEVGRGLVKSSKEVMHRSTRMEQLKHDKQNGARVLPFN